MHHDVKVEWKSSIESMQATEKIRIRYVSNLVLSPRSQILLDKAHTYNA